MGNPQGCNMEVMMENIVRIYGDEIDALLSAMNPQYRRAPHIKPVWWMNDLEDHPERYPKLAAIDKPKQKRYISYFLKAQGRVASSKTKNARGWILPEVAVRA